MYERLILVIALATATACNDAESPADDPTPGTADGQAPSAPQPTSAADSGATSTPASTGGAGSRATASAGTSGGTRAMAGSAAPAANGGGGGAPAGSTAGTTPSAGAGGSGTDAAGTPATDPAAAGGAASAPERGPATALAFEVTTEKVTDDPVFNVTRPADLAASDEPWPVIVWANGGCVRSDFTWMPLFERWAKGGFVVLSITNPGGEDDVFSMLSMTSKTEHAALIDWVVAQNEAEGGMFAGKLDTSRIVVAGNSCGGVTALEVAAEDDRLALVFVLSGSSAVGSVDTQIMSNVKVPVGYIVGGEADIAGENASGDYQALSDGIPAMIAHRFEGDHQTVSTDPMIAPHVAEIALNWMDLGLFGTKEAYAALTSPNVCDLCTPGHWTLESKDLEKLQK